MEFFDKFDEIISTLKTLTLASGKGELTTILDNADLRFEETGFDNWNGGTKTYTLIVDIPVDFYAGIAAQKRTFEEELNKHLGEVMRQFNAGWFDVEINPKVVKYGSSRIDNIDHSISKKIRSNIFDGLRLEKVNWAGELEDDDFLGRIFDLESLPSDDTRFKNAAQDIWQHRINNPFDWPDDWIYSDRRFNLLNLPANTFLEFLCEIVHPVVRPDRNESLKLVRHFNEQLQSAGWRLIEEELIAGRPRFRAEKLGTASNASVSRAKVIAQDLSATWMEREIRRLEASVDQDPHLAIGTAKELVESCCKTLLDKIGVPFTKSDGLNDLTKKIVKSLELVPSDIPDKAKGKDNIKRLLNNLVSISHIMAELRGLYGTGHGRSGNHGGMEPRHARLAATSAIAFLEFVTETYRKRVEQGKFASKEEQN